MIGPHNILQVWKKLEKLPLGKEMFSLLLGRMVPYTGTIAAKVLEMEPGHCLAEVRDRRSIRNHLNSIHAVALVNLGEMASGLAVLAGLPKGVVGIPVHFEVDYLKKARGTLHALGSCEMPTREEAWVTTRAEIFDSGEDLVTTFEATWKLKSR